MSDHWVQVRQEREALAELLPSFTEEQWETSSLCEGWSVRDVVAHEIEAFERELFPFVSGMLHARGRLHKHNQETMEQIRATTNEGLIARYVAAVDRRVTAGTPSVMALAEVLIHNGDIMLPLGFTRDVPVQTSLAVANSYRRIGMARKWKKDHSGVRLVATDTDWEYGDGLVASGPLHSIVMLLAGREAFATDFEGPGADRLRSLAHTPS